MSRVAAKRVAPRKPTDTETAWESAYLDGMSARQLAARPPKAELRRDVGRLIDAQAKLEGAMVGAVLVRVLDNFWRDERAKRAGYPAAWMRNLAQYVTAHAPEAPRSNTSARPVGSFDHVPETESLFGEKG